MAIVGRLVGSPGEYWIEKEVRSGWQQVKVISCGRLHTDLAEPLFTLEHNSSIEIFQKNRG